MWLDWVLAAPVLSNSSERKKNPTEPFAPIALSVLTQHRESGPYGIKGGEPGLPGRQQVIGSDNSVIELGSVAGFEVNPRARLILETPGGGGWGQL
jgi:5-oxoprolinase (ATP-hydrolysing)